MSVLKVDDASIYYELSGQGRPVLLIQGVGAIGAAWSSQVEGLSGEFQCLTFDNRGIGKSTTSSKKLTIEQMANDAQSVLDAGGWESAHVVGHSMGGIIAQQLALDVPQRVRSLSLLCTFSKGPEAARLTPWVLWKSLQLRVGSRRSRRRAFLEMMFTREYLVGRDTDELAAKLGPVIGRDLADQPPILMKQLGALGRNDRAARLGGLGKIPTLVVSGAEDGIARVEFGRRLAQLIPGAHFVEMERAAHGVILQEPEKINALLREHFLKSEKAERVE